MTLTDGDAVATALARYVRDFLPGTARGVTVISPETAGGLLGVYGKPAARGRRARVELARYEARLAPTRVEVVGRAVGPRAESWAVVVRAGVPTRPLAAFLADLLGRRVPEPSGDRELADRRVREWADWWCSLSG